MKELGYNLYSSARGARGGGVAILARKALRVVPIKTKNKPKTFECIESSLAPRWHATSQSPKGFSIVGLHYLRKRETSSSSRLKRSLTGPLLLTPPLSWTRARARTAETLDTLGLSLPEPSTALFDLYL
eukprot:sb/3475253/